MLLNQFDSCFSVALFGKNHCLVVEIWFDLSIVFGSPTSPCSYFFVCISSELNLYFALSGSSIVYLLGNDAPQLAGLPVLSP